MTRTGNRRTARPRRAAGLRSAAISTPALALILGILGSCVSTPVSTTPDSHDIRLELVEWARLAQNAHNVQPRRVVLNPERYNGLLLYVDDRRLLPETAPPARQVTISMGTFLAVLEARAAQLGYRSDITLFPEGVYDRATIGSLPVAHVRLSTDVHPTARYPEAGDIDALTTPTVKYRIEPANLSPAVAAALSGYSRPEIAIQVVSDPALVARLNELSIQAFEIEMRHEPTLMESYDLNRMNGRQRRRHPYGIAYTANFPARSLWLIDMVSTVAPQRPERYGEAGIRYFREALEQVTDYVLIRSSDNSRHTQIETGMVLQAFWMRLHSDGYMVLPNSQPLQEYPEMDQLSQTIHREYADHGETLQMVLAIARPAPGRHRFAPRFSAEALLAREVAR